MKDEPPPVLGGVQGNCLEDLLAVVMAILNP